MATAEEYAAWIVGNQDKQGTPEFETVASAYKLARGQKQERPAPTGVDRTNALITGANRGIVGLAGLPMDTMQNVYNLGKAAVGTVAGLAGHPELMPEPTTGTPLSSEWIASQLKKVGVNTENPRPDDPASRMLHTGGTIAGGSMVPGASVKGTAAAATSGAVAGEVLGDQYTALGAMAPAVAGRAVQAAGNAAAAKIAPTVQAFKDAGTTASVGQATESSFFRGLENLAAKFPGGVGVMRKFADAQQQQLGEKVRTGVSSEDAGRAIEKGITGEGGFVARFKATQDRLYNKLDQFIPSYAPINVTNTTRALSSINEGVPGAPNLSQFFINSKMKGIEAALGEDLKQASVSGALPYESIKKLRSLVGKELADSTIASDVPRSKWKALYGALSEDLGAAATKQGPQAEAVWKLANSHTKSGMGRIEGVLDRVIGNTPEETFARFMPKDANEANKVRAVMRSLGPDERKVVTDAVVNRLGRALPSKQNEVGDVFSSETFLTNWNKLSPGAKSQLFPDQKMRNDLDAVAKVSSNIREGSKTFANPSGTAGAAAPYGLGALAVTGNVAAAATLVGTAYIGGKMMTNPKVVDWLAKASTTKPEAMGAHLARLGVIYNDADPELRRELDKFIQQKQP